MSQLFQNIARTKLGLLDRAKELKRGAAAWQGQPDPLGQREEIERALLAVEAGLRVLSVAAAKAAGDRISCERFEACLVDWARFAYFWNCIMGRTGWPRMDQLGFDAEWVMEAYGLATPEEAARKIADIANRSCAGG